VLLREMKKQKEVPLWPVGATTWQQAA
jgi:hypothetical protein